MQWIAILLAMACHGGRIDEKVPVDMMELNEVVTEEGKPQFTQVILWKWSPDYRRYDVIRYYLVDDWMETPRQFYGRTVFRHYKTNIFRHTRTTHDPERDHKKLMDEGDRPR